MHPKVEEYLRRVEANDLTLDVIRLSGYGLTDEDIAPLIIAINSDPEVLYRISSIDLSHNNLTSVFGFSDMEDMIEVDCRYNKIAYIDYAMYQESHVLFDLRHNPVSHISWAKLLRGGVEDFYENFVCQINFTTLHQHFHALFNSLTNNRFYIFREHLLRGTNLANDHIDMVRELLYGDQCSDNSKKAAMLAEVGDLKLLFPDSVSVIDEFAASDVFLEMMEMLSNFNKTQRNHAEQMKLVFLQYKKKNAASSKNSGTLSKEPPAKKLFLNGPGH